MGRWSSTCELGGMTIRPKHCHLEGSGCGQRCQTHHTARSICPGGRSCSGILAGMGQNHPKAVSPPHGVCLWLSREAPAQRRPRSACGSGAQASISLLPTPPANSAPGPMLFSAKHSSFVQSGLLREQHQLFSHGNFKGTFGSSFQRRWGRPFTPPTAPLLVLKCSRSRGVETRTTVTQQWT